MPVTFPERPWIISFSTSASSRATPVLASSFTGASAIPLAPVDVYPSPVMYSPEVDVLSSSISMKVMVSTSRKLTGDEPGGSRIIYRWLPDSERQNSTVLKDWQCCVLDCLASEYLVAHVISNFRDIGRVASARATAAKRLAPPCLAHTSGPSSRGERGSDRAKWAEATGLRSFRPGLLLCTYARSMPSQGSFFKNNGFEYICELTLVLFPRSR